MTALLYARDFLLETVLQGKVSKVQLMFDEDNSTNEEEILQEDSIETVLCKTASMADTVGLSQITDPLTVELYVNQKG